MDNLIRHIKFPMVFDVEKLKIDVEKVVPINWVDHFNKNDYVGNWSSIALMSEDGKSENISAMNLGNKSLIYTEALNSCNYFKKILDELLFEKTSVRLLRLAVGAEIKPHKDYCLGYEDGCFRIHIPIITNPEVEFILNNERIIMNEGECWYIDANFTHSVTNKGNEDRIHLVIDGIRNKWTDALFFKEADQTNFIKPVPELKETDKERIIEELKRQNTATATKIIQNLR
ncbi:aspartyl/asparaginyl beta-hydroxylase domain-containing protein [Flavobacterium sp. SM15]|uniref:aspartyl/asparaginyl beta-hydroxylase domain-containing protein n=1 Tax=Flavobacterium sp. SM15 TaxID=2908005 RepID=UPI001ED9E74B|nr:aspartyl/asparaginyl beta-hydroxylase domain-containing protein [Flavobacterium sp. SM15]MCG2611439.1 aspartyl/asparaginyl beta-hydroxylase domain-containing protein [Flavobacterium sp. SM15]